MARGTPSEAEVADTLSHLKLSTKSPQKPAAKPKSKPVADSWDDEDLSGSDTETEDSSNPSHLSRSTTTDDPLSPVSSTTSTTDTPCPPPPTPASPVSFEYPDHAPYPVTGGGGRARGASGSAASLDRRPDKTTAVAGRLIAGALGVRAPRRTEEEREYDRAMREKERKRRDEERNREKAEKQAEEERKRAIWED